MQSLWVGLSIALTLLVIIAFANRHKIHTNKRYEQPEYCKKLSELKTFLCAVNNFHDYVTWRERDKILEKYKTSYEFFQNKTKYYAKEKLVREFNLIYDDFHFYIKKYNAKYTQNTIAQNKEFFDDIENKSLDAQQRKAVVVDEYSNLIIAGAGSGKTLTILAKVKYLVERKNISPSKILVLSFTRKTVEELNVRLKKMSLAVQATTFHKLGYDIIKRHSASQPPAVANENILSNIVKEYFRKDIVKNSTQMEALVEFLACYIAIPEEYDKFQSAGERIDHYRGYIDYETLKSKVAVSGNRDTLANERVRSVEELIIANFLFLNGIKYEYEKTYPHTKHVYRPDFYLVDYDIWLEHFGVDNNDRAKWLNSYDEKKYVNNMKKKRVIHRNNGTKLLETYSYYNRDNVLLYKLEQMLKENGVSFNKANMHDIYKSIMNKDKYLGHELEGLVATFVNLCKSRRLSSEQVKKMFTSELKDTFMGRRARLFHTFAAPIMEKYQLALDDKKEIDFNDMINAAADLVLTHGASEPYDYIIVDEYQDASFSRFNLLQAIRESSSAKLLCVGDDWQSIYRFAGSDISLFSDFGSFVGEYEKLLIENTHRNSQQLVSVASEFIQKNPKQIKKSPVSRKGNIANPINFCTYADDTFFDLFMGVVKEIVSSSHHGKDANILILGRHTFDIKKITMIDKHTPRTSVQYDASSGSISIDGIDSTNICYSTVHRAKGLEADNVIILNMENSQYGFPNKLADDPLITVLLSRKEDFRHAEERRLFYIALTRTKNKVYLLILNRNSSEFFNEIREYSNSLEIFAQSNSAVRVDCPWCETGMLMIRQNGTTSEKFLGCSHYPHCNQSYKDIDILKNPLHCDVCGSGFLIKKKGKYGRFLGCTNWQPDNDGCNNTAKII